MALIEGGFRDRANARRRGARGGRGYGPRRRQMSRAAAPLLIPLALALTLGVILAVSSATPAAHVKQRTTATTSSAPARR